MVFLPRVHLVMAEITNEAEFVLQIMELKVWCGLEKGRNGKPTDTETAICRSCHKRVAAKNGNTSNHRYLTIRDWKHGQLSPPHTINPRLPRITRETLHVAL